MIAILSFSTIAALLVFATGRRDQARDPRLTVLVLGLLAVFPVLWLLLPKYSVPLEVSAGGGEAGFPWMKLLFSLWAGGFLIKSVQLVVAAWEISRWRRRSVLISRQDGVEIRRLDGLRGPVAAGVFRPVVFVPEAWDGWSDDCRRMVLEHEMAHHTRRDPLWRWIAEISCAVNGGNPLVGWIARRLTMQCEVACDAAVLKNGVPAKDYAHLLCDFAEKRASGKLALSMSTSSSLEDRVRRLMIPRRQLGAAGIFTLVALAVIVAGGLAIFTAAPEASPVTSDEVELRWSANPFPGGN
ncbi:M56 family metallopeptidase [Luteolibacter yonseiensis]|uniref:M56 family metallopeptidase n=1 Tax=Luteolibacter yonseiensis TaxID=1144680 RepID=A0A934R6B8_9BACT|nr:M56 family metallopeptidase [Luteolibacter yonseiensis]MBK1817187.1 M56 family metallopeptidase [Luteolibacter yonseiensis]